MEEDRQSPSLLMLNYDSFTLTKVHSSELVLHPKVHQLLITIYFVCEKLRNLTSIDRHWSNISFSLHGWLHFKYIQMFSKIYRPGGNDISNIQQQTVVCLNCKCMHKMTPLKNFLITILIKIQDTQWVLAKTYEHMLCKGS